MFVCHDGLVSILAACVAFRDCGTEQKRWHEPIRASEYEAFNGKPRCFRNSRSDPAVETLFFTRKSALDASVDQFGNAIAGPNSGLWRCGA